MQNINFLIFSVLAVDMLGFALTAGVMPSYQKLSLAFVFVIVIVITVQLNVSLSICVGSQQGGPCPHNWCCSEAVGCSGGHLQQQPATTPFLHPSVALKIDFHYFHTVYMQHPSVGKHVNKGQNILDTGDPTVQTAVFKPSSYSDGPSGQRQEQPL